MATRKVGGGNGRVRIALLMLAFLVITGGIIMRRSFGIKGDGEIRELETRRAAMVNDKLRLEGEIRAASSRARLLPVAERLNLHVPADSQVISLPRTVP